MIHSLNGNYEGHLLVCLPLWKFALLPLSSGRFRYRKRYLLLRHIWDIIGGG
jgi:hypothetical protein